MRKIILLIFMLFIPNVTLACGLTLDVNIFEKMLEARGFQGIINIGILLWILQWIYFLYKFVYSLKIKSKHCKKEGIILLINAFFGWFIFSTIIWITSGGHACVS